MDGYGVVKYINGDEYHGDWMDGLRHGYGQVTEANVSGNCYYGDWSNDQCHGYSVYDNTIVIWVCSAQLLPWRQHYTFFNNKISEHHDSLLMDPNRRSCLGKVGGYFQLVGKGELSLHNTSKVTGVFSGNWFERKFQITNGSVDCNAGMETITGTDHHPLITNVDQRLGSIVTWTTPKWNTLFERCHKKLGFQPQPQRESDNSLSFWNYWHLVSSQHEKSATPPVVRKTQNKTEIPHLKRADSLAISFRRNLSGDRKSDRKADTIQVTRGGVSDSYQHSPLTITNTLPISSSTDNDRLHHLMKDYLDKAFADTTHHPLGILMSQLEDAYYECYSGIGASRFPLPQGICDAKHMIQQLHGIVRLFFPRFADDNQQLSMYGFKRSSPSNDPDDYVSIATGSFVGHLSADNDSEVVKALQSCSKKLSQISALFTAAEILSHMISTFTEVNDKVLQPLLSEAVVGADDLLPMAIYVTVKASVPLLGAILHYLYDFAFDYHEEGEDYTVTNYEVIYHYIVEEGKRLLQQHV
ncbi:alsin-like isoform X2 [Dysidea avara]|uniref:alsin-like isoform X2 n=1 Tax=Dysidea avara TaxID=196820 RepID=UPI00332C0873